MVCVVFKREWSGDSAQAITILAALRLFLLYCDVPPLLLHSISLDGVGVLQQLLELALLALQLGVAANVLLADEDVGHGALGSDLLEGVLDSGTVVLRM